MLAGSNFSPASAGTTWNTFGGIPFGETVADTRSMMAVKGYTFSERTAAGNDRFLGRILDTKTDIIAFYDDTSHLAKFLVNIETADDDARQVFNQLHTQLIAKYGDPRSDYHFFSSPYTDGDGYANSAIKLGKGTFSTYWPQPDGTDMVWLEITKQLTVEVGYEGPTWDAYVDRRRANGSKDL